MQKLSIAELENLVVIMRDMHVSAMDSNWQEIARLDSVRRVLLSFDPNLMTSASYEVNKSHHHHTSPEITNIQDSLGSTTDSHRQALVTEVMNLDKKIINTVEAQRKQLLEANRELSARTKVKNLYAQTSTMT